MIKTKIKLYQLQKWNFEKIGQNNFGTVNEKSCQIKTFKQSCQ